MLLLVALLGCGVSAGANELRRDNFGVFINKNSLTRVQQVFDSLDHLDLSGLGLRHIVDDAFQGCSKIKNLSLANNHLHRLSPLVFRDLVVLKYISLANNSLSNFQYAFDLSPYLMTIDIRNNGIEFLPNGSFYGILESATILIDGNHFGQVDAKHYEVPFPLLNLCMVNGIVHYLGAVSDEAQPAQQSQMTFQICKKKYRPFLYDIVSLGMEDIKGFKKGWYRLNNFHVTSLDLQLNEIEEITSELLNDLPESVSRVNLAWNRIKHLRAGVINNMNLRDLDLTGNKIVTIDENAFGNTRLSTLSLSGQFEQNSLSTTPSPHSVVYDRK